MIALILFPVSSPFACISNHAFTLNSSHGRLLQSLCMTCPSLFLHDPATLGPFSLCPLGLSPSAALRHAVDEANCVPFSRFNLFHLVNWRLEGKACKRARQGDLSFSDCLRELLVVWADGRFPIHVVSAGNPLVSGFSKLPSSVLFFHMKDPCGPNFVVHFPWTELMLGCQLRSALLWRSQSCSVSSTSCAWGCS